MSARGRLILLIVLGSLLAALPRTAWSEDYFLTIGGGYSPLGNQVSLEKNVLFFDRLLAELYPQGVAHDIFFADGSDPARDLQYHDPAQPVPRVHALVAKAQRNEKYLAYHYRNHQIDSVKGAATRENIERWFDEMAGQLGPGDRLFIYVTAHGSSDSEKGHNTTIWLWNQEKYSMHEFVSLLDQVPDEVPVVLVMVQCFAGGFAHVVFHEGDAENGPASADRCGFFATVHDRVAAGCTPDIDEEHYREYSSYFWAALGGLTRTGESVETCDFDGDGRVSLAEAHAYALIASDSIDISMTTSDAFLRAYSRTGADDDDIDESHEGAGVSPDAAGDGVLLTAHSPYVTLRALATPTQQVVLDELSRQLGLSAEDRAAEAKEVAGKLREAKQRLDQQRNQRNSQLDRRWRQIGTALVRQWPELASPWAPAVGDILVLQADAIVAHIEAQPSFRAVDRLERERDELADQSLDLDRRIAKCQRLIRTLESVALAANLPLVAPPEIGQRYQRLVASESAGFGASWEAGQVATDLRDGPDTR